MCTLGSFCYVFRMHRMQEGCAHLLSLLIDLQSGSIVQVATAAKASNMSFPRDWVRRWPAGSGLTAGGPQVKNYYGEGHHGLRMSCCLDADSNPAWAAAIATSEPAAA